MGTGNSVCTVKPITVFFLLIFCLCFLFCSRSFADILSLDGNKIEIVDGTIRDKDAKWVLDYSKNLYKRGNYTDARNATSRSINVYKGKFLPELHFLKAKSEFMDQLFIQSYNDFLYIYDAYRKSGVVKSGRLRDTVKKVLFGLNKKRISDIKYIATKEKDLSYRLDNLVKFYHLYKYVGGNPPKDIIKALTSPVDLDVDLTDKDMATKGSVKICSVHSEANDLTNDYGIYYTSNRNGRYGYYYVRMAVGRYVSAILSEYIINKNTETHAWRGFCRDAFDVMKSNVLAMCGNKESKSKAYHLFSWDLNCPNCTGKAPSGPDRENYYSSELAQGKFLDFTLKAGDFSVAIKQLEPMIGKIEHAYRQFRLSHSFSFGKSIAKIPSLMALYTLKYGKDELDSSGESDVL